MPVERNADGTFAAGGPVKSYRVTSVNGKRERLHRLRAERALGKPLPLGSVVHHADGTTGDEPVLEICQDETYHKFLHTRMRVKAAGGNPNTDRICTNCRAVKPIERFKLSKAKVGKWECRSCPADRERARTRKAKHRLAVV